MVPVGGIPNAAIQLVYRPFGVPEASIDLSWKSGAIAWTQRSAGGTYSTTAPYPRLVRDTRTRSEKVLPVGWTSAQPGAYESSLAEGALRGQVPWARWVAVNCDVAAGRCSTMFDPAFVEGLAAAHPGARFTAAVHDHRTGCSYSLNPDLALTTASVIKAQVLAGVLLVAQEQRRTLTESEAADVELMMHYSHNRPPASRLYAAIGGARGMEELDRRFGIVGTSHMPRYGATVSTAEDRTVLVEQLLVGGGPLNAASVQAAWDWMSTVSAVQSWGITAGLPTGYDAALKNGFYPSGYAGWRLGTTGAVRAPGGAYAVTVMTDHNPDEATGIALVEAITRHINAALTAGRPVHRRVDAVTCVESGPGWSWSSAAAALGDVEDSVTLRRLNGGEAAPLAGQRICRL